MKTKLIYLDDSYQKEMEAIVLAVEPDGNSKWKVILDQTIFYAMGGGQPTDQGRLESENWSGEVYQVMIKDGELWHFIKAPTPPDIGSKVQGKLNWERRYKNMQNHTAGHIIDFALYILGYSPLHLTPLKAEHSKKPYIMYKGMLEHNIKDQLQEKVNELIDKNLTFSWYFQSYEDLQKEAIYLQPNLPTNKPLRTFRLESVGSVADGGTQLRTTSEVGNVIVTSIDIENDATVIHYTLAN